MSKNNSPLAKSGPDPGFVNKVLLGCNHIHLLGGCLWLLLLYSGGTALM